MRKFSIHLQSIDDVRRFVTAACSQTFDIDITADRYIVDAKSILGLFSLDHSKPITVEAQATTEEVQGFYELVKEFCVD